MMRLLKIFWWVIFLPVLAYLFSLLVQEDPGLVMLSGTLPGFGIMEAKPFTVILTFLGLAIWSLIIFIAGYALLRLGIHILSLRKYLGQFNKKRRELASERRFSRAQLALIENNPRLAEDLFVAAAKHGANPSLCFIGAARAAQMQKNSQKRDRYLNAVDETKDKDNAILAGIFRAELLLDVGEYHKAQVVLEHLRDKKPNHARILALLATSYQKQGMFDHLYELMPMLHSALPKADQIEVEANLYVDLIDHIGNKHDLPALHNIWNHIPKALKTDAGIVINYAEKLLYCDAVDEAELLLRQSLKKNWNDLVITAYGHLFRGNLPLQIKHARGFFKSNPESAYAALAVARLLLKAQSFDEALQYVMEAIKIDRSIPDAHHLMAEIMVEKGEPQTAILSYKEASRLTYAKPDMHLLQIEGEYVQASPDIITLDHNPGKTHDETAIVIEDEPSMTHEEKHTV